MNVQYNEIEYPPDLQKQSIVMALDTGSPVVSVAVGVDCEVVVEQSLELKESSARLMYLIDSTLEQAELRLSDVTTLLGLRGPGSFTGLRVGMATLQGLTQALGVRVGTLSTLEVLATLGPAEHTLNLACVDALRGEWLVQGFSDGSVLGPPELSRVDELVTRSPCHLIGHGISTLRQQVETAPGLTFVEPGPLAGRAIEIFEEARVKWGFEGLKNPLYQRPPSAILPDR